MFPNLSTDNDSSSRCSTASPVGDTLTYYQQSPADSFSSASASPVRNTQELRTDMDVAGTPFVPTVTAISTTPDLQWMVQPTMITSVSPSLGSSQTYKVRSSNQSVPKAGGSKGPTTGRKGKNEPLSPEEEEKKRIRRERNKMAAAKCRNRRRELTDTLQAETDKLEEEKAALQTEITNLMKEKEKLELILAAHKPVCKIAEDLDCIFQEPIGSPQLLSNLGNNKFLEDTATEAPVLQDTDASSFPTTAISGNSNILLCSSADVNINDLEPSLDMKEEPLDDLLPSLEKTSIETARSVPDIDLSSSLGVTDWETLYKSVSSDLEALSTPVVTCTPTCTSYLSTFAFTYPEFDLLNEGVASPKAGVSKADSVIDVLNSPTLLAL
ncbi:protein c-Fos-like isoform X2 [Brienomyrus brachyistius]|nr:protein c-Fos-like isoform X2 [Brienomyrus brachyistius]XP_048830572.1 protein c-Fos-like isoform X2 [Brienomyrus brachyistius]XP_048830573.1 protein c-Fos-like isoform X2 [Brienomyrus brachyistius]